MTDTSGKGLGIAKTTTALKSLSKDKNSIFISQGDMWQGSVESNYTRGNLVTEWMNSMDFVSMTVGNHEYDWGSDAIRDNVTLADFPFLGINVVNKSNNQRVDYLQPSTTFERDGAKIGVIGAIGDCYSSISSSFVQDITFLTGSSLTALVKNESNRLRNEEHCDFIIYSIHGSFSEAGEYEEVLSNNHYVDLVLEGHTHQKYIEYDNAGILHTQCRGSNQDVIEINIDLNLVNKTYSYTSVNAIDFTYNYSPYKNAQEDAGVQALFDKYYDRYSIAYKELGVVSEHKDQNTLRSKIADLYYEKGYEKWHSNYNITLGGGYMSCRASGIGPGMVTYSDLNDCFPFDNEIVLCSISGTNFKKTQFITGSQYYFVTWADPSVQYSVNNSTTYYLVTDTYTSDYYRNYVTVIDYLSIGTYARDLLAEYILEGHWTDAPATVHAGTLDDPKTIEEAREQGIQHTSSGSSQAFYFKGVVSQIADYLGSSSSDMHGVYVKDEGKDNAMMIYYLKKFQGANNYNGNWSSVNDLSVGDVLIFYGKPYYYEPSGILEFASGTYCVSINGIPTA